MLGLTFDKLVLIGIIALFVVGPQRLPQAAARLARLVKTLRGLTETAKERVREEMGPDFDDVDWKKLDPRQYDPRRIIREALLDDEESADENADQDAPKVRLSKAAPVETELRSQPEKPENQDEDSEAA